MKTRVSSFLAAVALLLAFPPSLPATETEFTPSLQFSTGLAGSQNKLTWVAVPGTQYRILSSTNLSSWQERAIVVAESTAGVWLDPTPAGSSTFYQVEPPAAAVFSVEPAVLAPGAVLVISGQCLPAGSSVVFEIEGIPPVTAPIMVGADGRMTVTLPAFDIIVPPASGMGPHVKRATVVGPGGATVCVIGQTFEATSSGFASEPPPVPPPASPSFMAINEKGLPGPKKPKQDKGHHRMAGGGDDDEDCDDGNEGPDICGSFLMPALMKAKEKANKMVAARSKKSEAEFNFGPIARKGAKRSEAELNLNAIARRGALPGEVSFQQCDLELAMPAGPPLAFVRTCRSMNQPSSVCGTGWDHGFNVYITPVYDSTTLTVPTRVAVHTGDGRVEVMHRQADGLYRCDGSFREGQLNPDTSFTLTFADQSKFIFCPLVGAPWQGRIGSIVDRNGVALTCTYSAAGQLSTVSSQFGQSLAFTHDTSGRVTKVEDQAGRFVSLAYFGAGAAGGNEGDLQSVTCPIIPGQAPVRGPVTYTYSTGSPDPRLNSNLLTVRDGASRLQSAFIYATASASSASYDRCVACDRFSTDPADPVMHFSYEFLPGSGGGGGGGLLCTSNDEAGRVTEVAYDRMHRPMSVRRYTTFTAAGMPVTSTTNRPPAPPPGEPAFLQTTFVWNPDHLCTRCTEPDGLQTRVTYNRELRRDCPRRECGNARVITLLCPDATQPPRTVSMDYLPGFGTGEGVGIWGGEDGNGGCTDSVCGNPIGGLTIKGGRNHPPGSAMRPGSPIGGLSIKGGRNPGGNIVAQNRSAGPGDDDDCDGEDDDWSGSSNPIPGVGIVVKRNPGGSSTARAATSHTSMDRDDPCYCTGLTTTTGQVFTWGYDTHGNCTSSATPIAGSGTVRTYNSLGQCTSVRVLNGPGSSFLGLRQYDPVTHYLIGDTVDPDVNGTGEGLSITTTCVRNALGLITEIVDPRSNSTIFTYNACDQLVSISSPPLGTTPATAQRVVCTQSYDAGGLPFRCDLDHRDPTGALVAGNPHYTGFCVYNSRGLLVMEASEQKPVDVPPGPVNPATLGLANFDAVEFTHNAAGECVRVEKPAACRNQTASELCDASFNALGQLFSITAGGLGTAGAVTTEFRYSPSGLVTSCRTVAPAPALSPTVLLTYDAWRRLSTCTDETGNVASWSYANDGFVTMEVHGEVNDVPGSTDNVLLARGRGRSSRSSDELAFNVVNPRAARDNHLQGGVDVMQALRTIGGNSFEGATFSGTGTDSFAARGTTRKSRSNISNNRMSGGSGGGSPAARLLPAIQKIREGKGRCRPAFFDVFVNDDEWTWERFAPGAPAPHATETTTVRHSPAGLPLSLTRNGDVLYLFGGYDGAARLIAFAMPGSCSVNRVLDACGNVTSSTLTAHTTIPGAPDETFTTGSTYDPACRLLSTTDSVGNTCSFACDSLGRPVSVTQPGGLIVTCAYDTVSSTGTFSSCTVSSDYDADGITDHFVSTTSPGGSPGSIRDAFGYTTTFTCDSQNRITRIDYPDGTFETNTYNALGQRSGHRRKSGAVIACDFDYKGRVRTFTVTPVAPDTVAVAPAEFVWNGLDHCVQTTEGPSVVACTFDSLGNKLSETQNGHTVSHTYNHRGCTGTTYPGGERFSEQRNAHGLLLSFSIVNSAGVPLSPPITQRAYLGFACVADTSRNGVVTTRDFRSDGEPPLPFGSGAPDFTFGGCVRTTVTGPNGAMLENHIIRRNADQCETQHHRAFADGAAPPSRRMTFTLDARNFVTRCVTHVREVAGGPVTVESDVSYVLDDRGQRLSATGGSNPGLYTSSDDPLLGDRQMGQYSSWPGGSVIWRDDGDMAFLGRSTGGMSLVYDALSRLVEVRDDNGLPVAAYGYDAFSRRISSTLPGSAGLPSVTTFFLYAGPTCYQELDGNGIPEMTFGVSGGIRHCISTKNGSTYYPNGGGSSDNGTAFVFPILPAWPNRLEEVPVDDDITMTFSCRTLPGGGSSSRIGHYYDTSDCAMLTTSTGVPHERFASTDSCQPIFLNGDGLPTGASSSSIGFRWMQPGSAWCPESGLFQCPGGLYSPELGEPVSQHKTKPKKEKPVIDRCMWDLATNKKV